MRVNRRERDRGRGAGLGGDEHRAQQQPFFGLRKAAISTRLCVVTRAVALAFACSPTVASTADSCAKQVPYLVDRSLIIVAAKVVSVGRAPGFWSEVLPALQSVRYDVLATYKGKLPDKQITVDHKVVKGSRLTEKHPPGLSRQYFTAGNELILFLQTPTQGIGDECGVEHRSAVLEGQIQQLVKGTR